MFDSFLKHLSRNRTQYLVAAFATTATLTLLYRYRVQKHESFLQKHNLLESFRKIKG